MGVGIINKIMFEYILIDGIQSHVQSYINFFQMHPKRKKPEFKNPFDIEDEEDDEVIPIHQNFHSQQQSQSHHPLPFNPYVIKPENNQPKTTKPSKVVPQEPLSEKPKAFNPNVGFEQKKPYVEKVYELNEDGDPPLLEDIGIDPQMIKQRIIMVLKIGKPSDEMIDDPDLSGPTIIGLCFGLLLLLSGKVHFGDIYAIFIVGNFFIYLLFNFMSQVQIIPLYNVMSTMGYSLLPMLVLGLLGIFVSLKGTSGILLSLAIALWSSVAASNIMECLMKQTTSDRKPLLIYPLLLFYLSFAIIVIF